MHRDHHVFVQGIIDKRKINVVFFSDDHTGYVTKLCAPMDYESSRSTRERAERYYFWDFKHDSALVLAPSNIASMAPIEEGFQPAEFVSWSVNQFPWFLERDWGRFS